MEHAASTSSFDQVVRRTHVMARKSFSSLRSRWRRRRSARLKRSATKTTVTRTAEPPTANGHSCRGARAVVSGHLQAKAR
eukprot:7379613-Prymnesium_polylepis.2